MARYRSSRWNRLAVGSAVLVAAVALFVVRPGIALAHHVLVTETGTCAAWESKAEYVGGDEDRKVVVDVTINGEHISQTFYFDYSPGPNHHGHQDYWLLYDRAGAGALHSSGTVTLYARSGNGSYTVVGGSDSPGMNLNCTPPPTSTPTATATKVPDTATPVPSTSTPPSTATGVPDTATPRPTDTPAATPTTPPGIVTTETVTSLPSATSTPVITSATSTPAPTHTEETTGSIVTPAPQSTPTFVDTVLSSRRPGDSIESMPRKSQDRALPATGQGESTRGAIAAGLLVAALAALGLAACARGLRARQRP